MRVSNFLLDTNVFSDIGVPLEHQIFPRRLGGRLRQRGQRVCQGARAERGEGLAAPVHVRHFPVRRAECSRACSMA